MQEDPISSRAVQKAWISSRPMALFLLSQADLFVPPADAHQTCAICHVSMAGLNACSKRSSSCAHALSMNPRSRGRPWPAFWEFAVMPIFERVRPHRMASVPLDLRIRASRATSGAAIFRRRAGS